MSSSDNLDNNPMPNSDNPDGNNIDDEQPDHRERLL